MRSISSLLLGLILISLSHAVAQPSAPTTTAIPDLSLQIFSQSTWAAVPGEPILLAVAFSNSDSTNQAAANAQNERLRQRLAQEHALPTTKEAKERFEKEYGSQPISQIQLDPTGQGLAQEITFHITRDGKEVTNLTPHVLARSASLKGPAILADNDSLVLYFGFDDGAALTAATEKSPYVIEATWKNHPEAKSNPVQIHGFAGARYFGLFGPKLSPAEINKRNYFYGRYALLDAHYDQAEIYAQRLLNLHPAQTGGLELHADALAGQGKIQEAYEAFQLTHASRQQEQNEEGLAYATRRLWELDAQLNKK